MILKTSTSRSEVKQACITQKYITISNFFYDVYNSKILLIALAYGEMEKWLNYELTF